MPCRATHPVRQQATDGVWGQVTHVSLLSSSITQWIVKHNSLEPGETSGRAGVPTLFNG